MKDMKWSRINFSNGWLGFLMSIIVFRLIPIRLNIESRVGKMGPLVGIRRGILAEDNMPRIRSIFKMNLISVFLRGPCLWRNSRIIILVIKNWRVVIIVYCKHLSPIWFYRLQTSICIKFIILIRIWTKLKNKLNPISPPQKHKLIHNKIWIYKAKQIEMYEII